MTVCAILALVVTSYGSSSAFSLGPIRVTGAVDKPFKAEIPVRVDGKQGLKAQVGSGGDYSKIGVGRPAFLDKLSIEVADHPMIEGWKIIYITSAQPVYHPSFNLVIKARLGGGVILENYFLALDFQKTVNLSAPVSKEERKEMENIAKELRAMKPENENKAEPEPPTPQLSRADMLERMKEDELMAELTTRKETKNRPSTAVLAMAEAPDQPVQATQPEPIIEEREFPQAEPIVEEPVVAEPAVEEKPVAEKPVAEKPVAEKPVASPDQGEAGQGEPAPASHAIPAGVYVVKSGDNLYKIAKAIGAERKDYDRVVVALWRDNMRYFIKGNLHGLLKGARLDYSGLSETMKTITSAQAHETIRQQWPIWKGLTVPQPAPASQTQVAKADTQSAPAPPPPGKAVADKKENARPPADKETQTPEQTGSGHPYVIHVASFRDRGPAKKLAMLLRGKGYNAFEIFNSASGGNKLYRVAVNRFGSLKAAESFARSLLDRGIFRSARVLKLPFSIRVGRPVERSKAPDVLESRLRSGLPAYVMDGGPDGSASVFLGAFESRRVAVEALGTFDGLDPGSAVATP